MLPQNCRPQRSYCPQLPARHQPLRLRIDGLRWNSCKPRAILSKDGPACFQVLTGKPSPPSSGPCKQLYTPRTRRLQVAWQLRPKSGPSVTGGTSVAELDWKAGRRHLAPSLGLLQGGRFAETGPRNLNASLLPLPGPSENLHPEGEILRINITISIIYVWIESAGAEPFPGIRTM